MAISTIAKLLPSGFWHLGATNLIFAGAMVACLSGCGANGPVEHHTAAASLAEASREIGGKDWFLVKFAGSDDTVLSPVSGAIYSVRFEADGKVVMQLDCNRGNGGWSSPGQGNLAVSQLVVTRAMCQSRELQVRLLRDWANVQSYTVSDGHLFLALRGDGGIYEFGPANAPVLAEVRGSATYLERMALIPGDSFDATLEDVSIADEAAPYLGRTHIEPSGQVPIDFTITYDRRAVLPGHRYAVRARIARGEQLLFASDSAKEFDTAAPAPIELILRRVVTRAAEPALEGTDWALSELQGKPIVLAAGIPRPHLMFDAAVRRASGSLGCNRYSAGYALHGDSISLTNVVSTLMACMEGMDTEQAFKASLEFTARWRIADGKLELLNGAGKVLARLDAATKF